MDSNRTFIEKLHECNLNKKRLLFAQKKVKLFMPLTLDSYKLLKNVEVSFIDQMIFRYTKLQDTMGYQLFPGLLELLGEEVKSKSFIDRLNRLEELGLINKDNWMVLRKERNAITHEYSFNLSEVVDSINGVYKLADKVLSIYDSIYKYCVETFDFIND